MVMKTHIIGDIHGCRRPFEELLGILDPDPSRDRLILLGDLFDRGPDSWGVMQIVKKLADDFRYSDPVSSDSTADIEKDLTAQMGDLQAAVIDGNAGEIKELCRKIGITLTERNRLCKLGKKK